MSCCKISSQLVTLITTFSLLVVYMMLGAAMFSAVELPYERTLHNETLVKLEIDNASSTALVQHLTYRFNSSACLALEALEYFKLKNENFDSEEFSWTYTKSIMFAFSILTTLGYGDIVPTTQIGKGMAIIFALTTIPLYFSMVMLYAENGLSVLKKLIDKCSYIPSRSALLLNGILFGLLFLASLVFSVVYCVAERVTFGISLWYTFATFTTIGFGDYYPPSSNSLHSFYFMIFVTLVYILIGMIFITWKGRMLKVYNSIESYSSSLFSIFCHVSRNTATMRVSASGMTALADEPVDAEMEAVEFDPVEGEADFGIQQRP